MTEEVKETSVEDTAEETTAEDVRVYEVGYHILPTVQEEELESVVASIRETIDRVGGSLIAEGTPQNMKLAYTMYVSEGGKKTSFDRAHFGWIKFEGEAQTAVALKTALDSNANMLRFLIFKTVREDTRASVRPMTLREVKRTDTIKTTARKPDEKGGEVSEEALDKSIEELIAE